MCCKCLKSKLSPSEKKNWLPSEFPSISDEKKKMLHWKLWKCCCSNQECWNSRHLDHNQKGCKFNWILAAWSKQLTVTQPWRWSCHMSSCYSVPSVVCFLCSATTWSQFTVTRFCIALICEFHKLNMTVALWINLRARGNFQLDMMKLRFRQEVNRGCWWRKWKCVWTLFNTNSFKQILCLKLHPVRIKCLIRHVKLVLQLRILESSTVRVRVKVNLLKMFFN